MTISPSIPHVKISDLAGSQYLNCEKKHITSAKKYPEIEYVDMLKSMKGKQSGSQSGKGQENARKERGNVFEAELFATLQKRYPGKVHDHTNTSFEDSRRVLEKAEDGDILYQLRFMMPSKVITNGQCYYTDNRIGDAYRLALFIPDFLWIKKDDKGTRTIRVIDAKSSEKGTPAFEFQVASYAYLLSYIIQGLRGLSIDGFGGLWLPKNLDSPDLFRVDLMLPRMANYYTNVLVATFKKEPEWIYNEKCKSCDRAGKCAGETDILTGSIAYTSAEDLRAIKNDVIDIEDLVASKKPISIANLKLKAGSRFQADVDALQDKAPKLRGTRSLLMAKKVSNSIYISLLFDPTRQMPCAYAIRAQFPHGTETPNVINRTVSITESKQADYMKSYQALTQNFVDDLAGLLDSLKADCSIFVYSKNTMKKMEQWLLHLASSGQGDTQNALRCLFALFHGPTMLTVSGATSMPAGNMDDRVCEVPFLASVEHILKETVALGLPGYYPLSKAAAWMNGTPDKESNDLEEDTIYKQWESGKEVHNMMEAQNDSLHAIVTGVRAMADKSALKNPKDQLIFPLERDAFKWPVLQTFTSTLMAKIAYFYRLECLQECNKERAQRLKDFSSTTPNALVLKCSQKKDFDGTFTAEESGSPAVKELIEKINPVFIGSKAKPYLLVSDDMTGTVNAIQFRDAILRNQEYIKPSAFKENPIVVSISSKNGATFKLNGGPNKWEVGKRYRLYKRFKDGNMDKLFQALNEMDREEQSVVEALLRDPNQWAKEVDTNASLGIKETTVALRKAFDLSPAQKTISEELLKKRLQILWGPPGAGKSHFLNILISQSVRRYERTPANGPLLIAVTASRNDTIDNVLRMMRNACEESMEDEPEKAFKMIRISKFKNTATTSSKNDIQNYSVADCLKAFKASEEDKTINAIVVGGTVWDFEQMRVKEGKPWSGFDMLVMEESSQILVPKALMAIHCLHKTRGRLVLSGDHMQVGPILQNEYSVTASQEPILCGSIQQCLMRTDANKPIPLQDFMLRKGERPDFGSNTIKLLNNWRMNAELNAFFQKIYGEDYLAHYPKVCLAHDSSKMSKYTKEVQDALDPSKAITVVRLSPARTANEFGLAQLEANVVRDLVNAHMEAKTEKPANECPPSKYQEELEVMVIAPWRRKYAITSKLSKEKYFNMVQIDTAEKLRSQQCELAIICFACHDLSSQDFSFLMDSKQWNVAMSRARCKVIVITTDTILGLESSSSSYQGDKIAEVTEYMRMIKDWGTEKKSIVQWSKTS